MKLMILGTSSYKVITQNAVFWEYDFKKAKLIYDKFKKQKKLVKIILEQWEGEIGGTGVHSEDVLFN